MSRENRRTRNKTPAVSLRTTEAQPTYNSRVGSDSCQPDSSRRAALGIPR